MRSMVGRSACVAGPHSDGCDQAEAGLVTLVFALAAPEPVLVVAPGELATHVLRRAGGTHRLRHRLAPLSGLRPLGRGGEEQMRQTLAGCQIHPAIVGQLAM